MDKKTDMREAIALDFQIKGRRITGQVLFKGTGWSNVGASVEPGCSFLDGVIEILKTLSASSKGELKVVNSIDGHLKKQTVTEALSKTQLREERSDDNA